MIKKKITKKRGDTFWFPFKVKNDRIISADTVLRCVIKTSDDPKEYALSSEQTIEKDTSTFGFIFPASETKKLIPSEDLELEGLSYILELELTANNGYVETIYQEEIEIVRDYIHE